MAVIHIMAFFLCLFFLSYYWKESLVEVIPVLACMLVLALYALAMLRRLFLLDGIAVMMIAGFALLFISWKKEKRADFGKACLHNIRQPSFVAGMMLLFVVILCTSRKVVTWWDDINFWATDVKSLYYLDGFANQYGNVAPEFGDYPPGAQLMKWWFLHFDPDVFQEGLAFAGYYTMNLVFMLPLLKHVKGKNVFILFGMAAALWFLPSIAEIYGYDGFCADLTMACIYGGFLFAVTDREGKAESFYYGRLALYLSVLVLVKSIGFIWGFFGVVFMCLYQNKERRKKSLSVCVLPLVTGASWMLFCLVMRRVTKTTATVVKYMTTDEYGISGYTRDYAKAFIEAFVSSPLHKEKGPFVDLTPLGFYVCICLLVVFFYHRNMMPRKEGRLILWFSVISGALFYGIIFIAHITIFAMETQYLEASGMISSIERYGAPFTIGTLLFLANIWMKYGGSVFVRFRSVLARKYGTALSMILFVALTAGWRSGYYGLIGYRADVPSHLAQRKEMIDADAVSFLQALDMSELEKSTRICYIQRDDVPRWVKNSYTNLEASPISVIYKSVNLADAPTDWMAQEIRDSHASYLYVEDTDADAAAVFAPMMGAGEGAFYCGVVYQIEDDGQQMRLMSVPGATE